MSFIVFYVARLSSNSNSASGHDVNRLKQELAVCKAKVVQWEDAILQARSVSGKEL